MKSNYYHNQLSYCGVMSLNQHMCVSALVPDVSYPLKESAAVLSDDGKRLPVHHQVVGSVYVQHQFLLEGQGGSVREGA